MADEKATPTPAAAPEMPAQATGPYDQFILFGDSLMEFSANQSLGFGFMPALQHEYVRKLDVINRGFAGYTTAHAIRTLPKFMPTPDQAKVRILLVFFGANDACLAGTPQHVPLEEYKTNLRKMARHPKVRAHKPTRVLIVTPPPVNEYAAEITDKQKGFSEPRRTAEHTQKYAHAAKQVAEEIGVPVVDMWSVMMAEAGWKQGEPLPGSKRVPESPYLQGHFLDGLHFSPAGYQVLFREVKKAVAENFPKQKPAALKRKWKWWKLKQPRPQKQGAATAQ